MPDVPAINRILKHATETVPAYRAYAGRTLREFPITMKADYRRDYETYICDELPEKVEVAHLARILECQVEPHERLRKEGRIIFERSSGTTGPSLWYPRTQSEVNSLALATAAARSRYFSKWEAKYFRDLNVLFAQEDLSTALRDEARTLSVYDALQAQGVKHLYGHAGLLWMHAALIMRHARKYCFTIVESAGEELTSEHAQMIRAAFGASVLNQYGTRESWAIGYESDAGVGFELLPSVTVEIVSGDGRLIGEEGTVGRIVVTSHYFRVFPIIRFDTGDAGMWSAMPHRKLILETERAESKIESFPGHFDSGNQILKRELGAVRGPDGTPLLHPWKVRKKGNLISVYLHPMDLRCQTAVSAVFSQLGPAWAFPLEFVSWEGWAPYEKRIPFLGFAEAPSPQQ